MMQTTCTWYTSGKPIPVSQRVSPKDVCNSLFLTVSNELQGLFRRIELLCRMLLPNTLLNLNYRPRANGFFFFLSLATSHVFNKNTPFRFHFLNYTQAKWYKQLMNMTYSLSFIYDIIYEAQNLVV